MPHGEHSSVRRWRQRVRSKEITAENRLRLALRLIQIIGAKVDCSRTLPEKKSR